MTKQLEIASNLKISTKKKPHLIEDKLKKNTNLIKNDNNDDSNFQLSTKKSFNQLEKQLNSILKSNQQVKRRHTLVDNKMHTSSIVPTSILPSRRSYYNLNINTIQNLTNINTMSDLTNSGQKEQENFKSSNCIKQIKKSSSKPRSNIQKNFKLLNKKWTSSSSSMYLSDSSSYSSSSSATNISDSDCNKLPSSHYRMVCNLKNVKENGWKMRETIVKPRRKTDSTGSDTTLSFSTSLSDSFSSEKESLNF